MGWGRTLLLGDVGNRLDIAECEQEISSMRRSLRDKSRTDVNQDEELRRLRREVDELKLCLSSLTRILTAKGVVEEGDLSRFARVIDDDDVMKVFTLPLPATLEVKYTPPRRLRRCWKPAVCELRC